MRHDTSAPPLLLHSVPFIAAAIAIYLVIGMKVALLMPFLAASLAISYKFVQGAVAKMRARDEMDSLAMALKVVHHESGSNGRPLISSMLKAASSSADTNGSSVISAISRVARRMSMGQDLDSAMAQERGPGVISGAFAQISKEYSSNSDVQGTIKGIYTDIEKERELERERASGAMHKHLITSMVASTVLPSISVFGFVGYSIFYYSFAELAAFSVIMLAALPGLSIIVNSKIADAIGQA